MTKEQELLKKYYGYENFRPGQEKIISNILSGKDVLGIMPTGAGKSVCYQIPSLILPGITIVISPLISLMKDQVDYLNKIGIPSAYVNSSLSKNLLSRVLENISKNSYKIIYISPERLELSEFIHFLQKLNISMITVDEAHCISQWGHDFRKSYLKISSAIKKLPSRPIVSAFTATATEIVKNDIIKLLDLHNPYILTTGFDRENLRFYTCTPNNKLQFILEYIRAKLGLSGIIYCSTRKNVNSIFQKLSFMGFSVSKYHGGMNEKERATNQNEFILNKTNIMVATNAFGMGINKPNIRYVIHYNMPKDLENYYQEAGRAGRDGKNSECILLFSEEDIKLNKYLIKSSTSLSNCKLELDKLNSMIKYCNMDTCLRKFILEYFGEKPSFNRCNNCSNCLNYTFPYEFASKKNKKTGIFDGLDEKSNLFEIFQFLIKKIFNLW